MSGYLPVPMDRPLLLDRIVLEFNTFSARREACFQLECHTEIKITLTKPVLLAYGSEQLATFPPEIWAVLRQHLYSPGKRIYHHKQDPKTIP